MPELRLTIRQRQIVAQRASGCCEYCRSQACFSPDPFSVEHIVPRSRGGTDELDNLALSCQGCNSRKYTDVDAIDPTTGERAPLYHPRRQKWTDHFAWSDDATLVIGLTPTGRATVEKLQLNRSGLVNLRRVLQAIGRHPPADATEAI
ncbi:MAG: HNH endonuclease [Anaerolineae bacterium CG2_30_64_16]|nr:MAG: HNH endonuclease [Anaerolineae bacterium CG2_30_64_16]